MYNPKHIHDRFQIVFVLLGDTVLSTILIEGAYKWMEHEFKVIGAKKYLPY